MNFEINFTATGMGSEGRCDDKLYEFCGRENKTKFYQKFLQLLYEGKLNK